VKNDKIHKENREQEKILTRETRCNRKSMMNKLQHQWKMKNKSENATEKTVRIVTNSLEERKEMTWIPSYEVNENSESVDR
jgi:hypothetical protein